MTCVSKLPGEPCTLKQENLPLQGQGRWGSPQYQDPFSCPPLSPGDPQTSSQRDPVSEPSLSLLSLLPGCLHCSHFPRSF